MFTLTPLILSLLLQKTWSAYDLQQVESEIQSGDGILQVTSNISQLCLYQDFESDTVLELADRDLILNTTCVVRDVSNWTLRPHSDVEVATIKCSQTQESGFQFVNVQNLTISRIKFFGCGSQLNVMLNNNTLQVESALFFINGSNLSMRNVNVSNATSAGIVILNVGTSVIIDGCVVQNALSRENTTAGGTIVAYDNSTLMTTTVKISNCNFTGNGYEHYRKCKSSTFGTISYSSGLVMFLWDSNLKVRINNTVFSNNSGCSGGNMALYLSDYVGDVNEPSICIENTSFLYGKAQHGGGLYVSFEETVPSYNNNNPLKALLLTKSRFKGNYAEKNGGGLYFQWKQSLQVKLKVDAVISHTEFAYNKLGLFGYGGLALHYQTYSDFNNDPHKFVRFRVNLNISNCSFHHHYQNILTKSLLSRRSVIQVKSVPYIGLDGIHIISNKCTGLMAVGSNLVFFNSSTIRKNSALMGAGIRLCANSLMYFNPNTTLEIVKNSAEQRGGGILVSSNCLVSRPLCFYQFTPEVVKNNSLLETINITVKDNIAPKGGDNIFGGSLDYCYLLSVKLDNIHFQSKLNVPNNTMTLPSSISSNPQQVCFQEIDGDRFQCGKKFHTSVYPGQQVVHNFSIVGQVNGSISGTVRAWTKLNATVTINDRDIAQTVDISGQTLKYNVLTKEGATSGEINFEADLNCNADVSDYARKFKPAVINVTFLSCPFGFPLTKFNNRNWYRCSCSKNIPAIQRCSISSQTIIKKPNQWIGSFVVNNISHFAYGRCPLDYCNDIVNRINALSDRLDQDKQCRHNRTGVLCGSCPEGWSLVLGSSECRQHCSNAWLLLTVPFALAGLLLVLVIHYLNLTVTMGTVCGLIFYANIIQGYSISLLSTHPIPILTPFLRVFLAWLNLDFGIAACFYNRMGAFGKTMIQGLFPLYIWAISAVIILLSRRYVSVTRVVGNNAVKVLATLFLLSYSKMLRVTISSLNLVYLNIQLDASNGNDYYIIRWAADGNVSYTNARHLVLVILTVFFLVLSLPFSVILLCIRHAYSLPNHCRLFSWIDKLKPFFDAYLGPYKDNARFWTGLLLFIRVLYLTVHTIDYNNIFEDIPFKYAILVNFVLSSLMIPLKGVYKKHWLNVLEGSLLFNMGFLFITRVGKPSHFKCWVAHFLVFLAFLTFLGIVAYHVHLKLSGRRCLRRRVFWRRRNADLDVGSFEDTRGADYMDDKRDFVTSTEDEDLLQPIT